MKLSKLALGLSLAVGFMATAAAQTTMRISISIAQNSHQGTAIDTFGKEVEKRTAGRYKVMGIVTTPMAFPEVFTALQQGTVDGQENPLSVIMAAKFDQVQKHLSLTGHVYSPGIFLMNKAAFDKLSAADKQAFLDAAKEGVKANRARVDE